MQGFMIQKKKKGEEIKLYLCQSFKVNVDVIIKTFIGEGKHIKITNKHTNFIDELSGGLRYRVRVEISCSGLR